MGRVRTKTMKRVSRVLIGVRPLLLFLFLFPFILSFSRSSQPLPVPPSHPPSPLEHRSRLSDQSEPTFFPLRHIIRLLELLLTFVFVYFTCTSDFAEQSRLRLAREI